MNKTGQDHSSARPHSKKRGQCLCGRIVVQIDEEAPKASICHCQMCRRWASAPWMATLAGDDLIVQGGKYLLIYQSSSWAERAFCSECGSHIYYHLVSSGEIRVSAGLFDRDFSFSPEFQLFIDKKPVFYAFVSSLKKISSRYLIANFMFGKLRNYLRALLSKHNH